MVKGKWLDFDTCTTEEAAKRMKAYHEKHGREVKVLKREHLSASSDNKIQKKKVYEIWNRPKR